MMVLLRRLSRFRGHATSSNVDEAVALVREGNSAEALYYDVASKRLAVQFHVLGFFCYVLLTVCFVWSFRFSKWDSRPDMPQWKEISIGRREEELQRWLGDAYVEAYSNNEPVLERKAGMLGLSLWFLAGEAACLTIAVLAPLWPPW